jgi:hypothetical protein
VKDKASRDLKVYVSSRDIRCDECDECGEDLGRRAWITLAGEGRATCLTCADLDHLVVLPAGDTAFTRRALKSSGLTALVLKWSRARKRYERQGLLVEDEALEPAEQECAADTATREARRASGSERSVELGGQYVARFAACVRELFTRCPRGREKLIAEPLKPVDALANVHRQRRQPQPPQRPSPSGSDNEIELAYREYYDHTGEDS